MQSLWKYIDDLVGKGLDFITIGQFLWYASASLLMLAMPIAILISSIMTFGNLGESFELVAIKSSGISLLRFMRPLIWFTVLLCFITFLFANYVIPYSELKFVTLYKDIMYKKPALNMKEGVFYTDISNYAIKVTKKNPDGNKIQGVLIYDQSNPLQDNTLIANSGKMSVSPDNNYLQFNLENGNRYQEKGNFFDSSNEYIRMEFKTLKKLFDLSALQLKSGGDSSFRNNYKMLNAKQLNKNIDSLVKVKDSISTGLMKNMTVAMPYFNDSATQKKNTTAIKYIPGEKLFPDSAAEILYSRAVTKAGELKNSLFFGTAEKEQDEVFIMLHKIEWHRKFALSVACLVFLFIGAPLGSITRRGGLGMPILVALIFFTELRAAESSERISRDHSLAGFLYNNQR